MKLYRSKELAEILQISLSTLRRMMKEGDIPQPIKIGERNLAWRKETIETWLESKERIVGTNDNNASTRQG